MAETRGRPKGSPALRDDAALDMVEALAILDEMREAAARHARDQQVRLAEAHRLLVGADRSWRIARQGEVPSGSVAA